MKTLEEILKQTERAVNESVWHYFDHLAAGEAKVIESQFLAEKLLQIQPWLFFSEGSLENISNLVIQNANNVNATYNLTTIFYSRLSLSQEEMALLINHMASSADVGQCENPSVSFMPPEYRDRLFSVEAALRLLENNRKLVFLYALTLFIDTAILEKVIVK